MSASATRPLLKVSHLSKIFTSQSTRWSAGQNEPMVAVDDVSFDLAPSTTLGIVGESGSGKTTLVRSILRAMDPTKGECLFQSDNYGEVDLATLTEKALKPLRQEIQMIFQDPFSSLNPRMTVQQILEEPLRIHNQGDVASRSAQITNMLDLVSLPRSSLSRFPHAFSGGQRQRIGIARALMLHPKLVVCDESVSALDVSVQAQIINLLKDLQRELGLTYLFVAHDLAVVRHICNEVLVMHKGRVVEHGPVADIFDQPQQNYTKLLLSAIPSIDPDKKLTPLSRQQLNLV